VAGPGWSGTAQPVAAAERGMRISRNDPRRGRADPPSWTRWVANLVHAAIDQPGFFRLSQDRWSGSAVARGKEAETQMHSDKK